jgi:hypothetical protein
MRQTLMLVALLLLAWAAGTVVNVRRQEAQVQRAQAAAMKAAAEAQAAARQKQ